MASFPQGAVFSFDHDLRYLSAGGQGLADVGLSRAMLEGRTIFEAFPPETAAAIEPLYRAALRGETTTIDVPYGGRIFQQRLAPVIEEDEVVAGLGFTQDVTEARAAEAALLASEQRMRLTFDNAPIGEAIVNLDGSWREVNAALTELTGYSREQLLTMTFQDITHPDDLELDLEHVRRLMDGEISSYEMEKRYLTAGGAVVWVLLSGVVVRDADGEPLHFIAQILDITERKRQQTALQDLTAMLAHDLRTPTTVIAGYVDLLLASSYSQEHERERDMLERVSSAARTMQALLENALTATALDAQGLEVRPTVVHLPRLVTDVLRAIPRSQVEIDVSDLRPVACLADQAHLTQVLTNLVTNAIKYGGDRIGISAEQDGEEVVVVVSDNGPGVPREFVPELFERFSRSETARRGAQRGSGLGLYIVRDLLGLNGGSIAYEDAPGGGARFVVRLPLAPGRTGG
jgi:PAS domain S-box-containing protein